MDFLAQIGHVMMLTNVRFVGVEWNCILLERNYLQILEIWLPMLSPVAHPRSMTF